MNAERSFVPCGTIDCPIAIYHNWGKEKDFSYPSQWHMATEFLLVKSGSLEMMVDGRRLLLEDGDILLIEPRVPHNIVSNSGEVSYVQLLFSPEAVALPSHHILQSALITPLYEGTLHFPRLLRPGHPIYKELYDILSGLQQYRMTEPNYKLRRFATVVNLCAIVAPYCFADAGGTEGTDLPDNAAVKKAVIYIQNHKNRELTLEAIAAHVHLHPNYLCALFKKHMGESIFQYTNRRRIEHAAVLLRTEDIPINQLPEAVGFRSSSLFFKKFRQIMGCTPLTYARRKNSYADLPQTDVLPEE